MKILVADDSKTNLCLIISYLKKFGHEPIPASSGEEAIELYKQQRPDLIILDVVMEGLGGFETAKSLRSLNNNEWIPIIFLSSQEDDKSIAQGIDAGGDDYLTKPISEIKLAAKIKAMQRIADMQQKLYETTQKLSVLSSTDTLTSLYNRFQFERTLREKIAHVKRHECLLILMFIDLDHFKVINDTLGHHIGDLLLIEVAKRLRINLREDDFIARLGGDEFAVILGEIDHIDATIEIAKKILDVLSSAYDLAEHDVHIGASIGITCYPSMSAHEETIVQDADVAMYHAKKKGRNNFQYFNQELNEKHQKRVYLENSLKVAIPRKQLFLMYQPIFQFEDKKIIGVEAFVGWKHPKMGVIPANIFIPIAEEENLISQIDEWVLGEACKQRVKWNKLGYKNLQLAVNVSSRLLLQKEFPEIISDKLKMSHLSPNLLRIELTESSVMANIVFSEIILKKISKIGTNIVVDHFGTGFSSLVYLKKLPINAIKIDKSFLNNIGIDNNSAVIVKSAITLGNNLGLSVIGTGIETEEQFQFLKENNCHYGQGFYLSRPLSFEQMSLFLQKNAQEVQDAVVK